MKSSKCLLYMILIAGFLCIDAYAVDLIGTDGAANSSGIYAIQHTDDRVATFAADAGIKYPYERAVTGDTLTAAETGKTVSTACTTACTFILPVAAVGMEYSFASEDNVAAFSVDPNGTDTIKWLTLSAGDKVTSPGNTGDSITLFSTLANVWTVKAMQGSFTDGN